VSRRTQRGRVRSYTQENRSLALRFGLLEFLVAPSLFAQDNFVVNGTRDYFVVRFRIQLSSVISTVMGVPTSPLAISSRKIFRSSFKTTLEAGIVLAGATD